MTARSGIRVKGKGIRRPVSRVSADDRQGGKEDNEEAKEDRTKERAKQKKLAGSKRVNERVQRE